MECYALLFSGGKESVFALAKVLSIGINVDYLLCNLYDFPRPSPHTLNIEVVELIAEAVGIPLIKNDVRGKDPKKSLIDLLESLCLSGVIAGDIFVEEHRKWLESICDQVGIKCLESLWDLDTEKLLREEVRIGLRPMIVGVDTGLIDTSWLGKILNQELVEEFISLAKNVGMDPCGEYGEYHTLVLEGPPLNKVVKVRMKYFDIIDHYGLLTLSKLETNCGSVEEG